jgi:hypothetical protein
MKRAANEQYAACLGDLGSGGGWRRALQRLRGRGDGRPLRPRQAGDGDLLRRRFGRHPGDGAAHAAVTRLGPGDRRWCRATAACSTSRANGTRSACAAPAPTAITSRRRREMAQVIPTPYADVSAQTMLPTSHLVWSALWSGIATDAGRPGTRLRPRRGAPEGRRAGQALAARRGGKPAAADEVQRRRGAAPVRGGARVGGQAVLAGLSPSR